MIVLLSVGFLFVYYAAFLNSPNLSIDVSNATLLVTACSGPPQVPNCTPGNNYGKLSFTVENTGRAKVTNITVKLDGNPWNGSLFSSPSMSAASPLAQGASAALLSGGLITRCAANDNTITVSATGDGGQVFQTTVMVSLSGSCAVTVPP